MSKKSMTAATIAANAKEKKVNDVLDFEQFNKDTDSLIGALNDIAPDKWYVYLEQTIKCKITSLENTRIFITDDNKQLTAAEVTTEILPTIKKAYTAYVVHLEIVEGRNPQDDEDGKIEIRKPLSKWERNEETVYYKGCSYFLVKDIVSATRKKIEQSVGQELLITPTIYVGSNGKNYINHTIERAE